MDPRSPYLPNARYVPRHPQPPPPLQSQSHPHSDHPFSNNPNIYAPHHSTLLAAPTPLRPQPQPQPQPRLPPPPSYHSLPAPPQFNPHNSQFSYNPNTFDTNHLRSNPDVHNFTQSPRLMHHKPFDDDLPRRFPDYIRDNRPGLRGSPRVLADRWLSRPYPPPNLDPDSCGRSLDNQPISPMKIRRELEGNSRFIGEQKQRQELVLGRGDDNYHRRSQFGSTSDRSSRDFRMVSNQMNHSSPCENLRGLPYDDGMNENQRWVHGREVNRDSRYSFTERGSNEIGDSAGMRVAIGKREHYRCREVNAQLERHSTKGNREDSYEFSRTPRKPPQKKSALLRIQKPNYRNREDERVHYLGYLDDNKSSSFRGKDQNLYQNHDMGEQMREGSPVELDVSFKSNSLVAKAISTPSSVGASDLHVTSRNEKVRKGLVLNKDSSSSSVIQPREGTVKLENAVLVSNDTSSSDKDLLQPKVGGTASGICNVHDKGSLSSRGTKTSLENSKVETSAKSSLPNKCGTSVISGKTSSLKVSKKKKIVKRAVKKVANPLSSSSSQPTVKCDGSVTADGFAHGLPAYSEPEKNAAIASVHIDDSQPHSNETLVVPETQNDRIEGLAKVMVSDNGTFTDSGGQCLPNLKRKRSHSTSPLGSLGHEDIKINENLANASSANCLHGISSTDKDFGKFPYETTTSDIDSLEPASKQLCLDGHSFLHTNNAVSESPKVLANKTHSAEGNPYFGLLSSEENKVHKGPASSYNTTLGCESDSGLISDGITDSNIGTTDIRCKEPCINQGNLLVENGAVDQFLNANSSVASGKILWQSNSGERTIQNVATCASCSNEVGTVFGSDNGHSVSGEINVSSYGTADDVCERPTSDRVSLSLENVPAGGSLDCMISTDGSKKDAHNFKKSNKNVEISQLHLSKSEVNSSYLEPVNMFPSAAWVDTTLRLSFKDPVPTEFTVSGDDCKNIGLQGCTDGICDFCQRTSQDVSEANVSVNSTVNVGPNRTSSHDQKKRKFSSCQVDSSHLIASDESEGPLVACISELAVEVPSDSGNGLMKPEHETTVSAMNHLFTSDLLPLQKDIAEPLDSCSVGGYHGTEDSLRGGFLDSGLRRVYSSSTGVGLAAKKMEALCPSGLESKQITDSNLVRAGNSHQSNSIDMASGEAERIERMDVDAGEEQDIADSGTAQCQFPSEIQFPESDERLPSKDVENDSCRHMNNDLPSISSYLSSLRDGNEVSTTNSSGDVMGLVSDTLSDMDCLEKLPAMLSTSHSQLSLKVGGDDEILLGKHASQGGSNISVVTNGSPNTSINFNLDHGVENGSSFMEKTGLLPSQDSRNSTQTVNSMSGEVHGRKNQPTQGVSRTFLGRSSVVFAASKSTVLSTHISKPRTWHRTDNPSSLSQRNKDFSSTVPTPWKFPKKVTKFQNSSYIRKGNSLVRNPTTVAAQSQSSHGLSSVYRLPSLGTDELKKNAGSDTRAGVDDPTNFVRTGVNAAFERPRTPPLANAAKLPNHAANSFGDCTSSPLVEPLHNCASETASDNMASAVSNDVLKSSENATIISENPITQTGQINNVDCRNELNNGNTVTSNANSVTYVKRKSNQLVATSNPCLLSVNDAHNIPALPSDGYYKRRKNQLVRTSVESHVHPKVMMPNENINPEGQSPHNIMSNRSSSKRRSRKVVTKSRKPSKFSFVWTLRSAQLSNDNDSLHRQKFLPHLFPWKRATYWRSFMPNTAASPSNNPSSTISRKLLLLRKRDTVYTRSKHGFSLRKSKVLSVGGASLKWSKSIARRSKKANEEATLAVAEAERKKREQSGASCVVSGTKNRSSSSRKSVHSINMLPGDRIFRIGSFRYKMDSSRRTLQRILDDDSSCWTAFQTLKGSKRPYVPRRLVIGKDEYVRIGNGNQLVRDPKKRTRILASEKVRWSLHTARSRLARKRKYCQFFTRFGKCNKDSGKCPYIHDSSKIAVCTKFLNGLCFNSDCKLTHKVIPERMPDCSYYLQGLCTNINCPYRHVHVNPNASTCEGFLRGYCADGNECRKKHSYVCPTYEATGSCPQGSKCKLHHPKNRSKGKKSKQSREKKNAQGRYFGSMHTNVSEPGTAESETYSALDNSKVCFEGSIGDYISLDDGDAARENISLADEQASYLSDADPLDLQLVDLDALIKPIRIMT